MPITLQRFAVGDINYISKHNGNYALIEAVVNPLITQVNESLTGEVANLLGFQAAYGPEQSTLIDVTSYALSNTTNASGGVITLSAGYAWLHPFKTVVRSPEETVFSPTEGYFLNGNATTQYVYISAGGSPYLDTQNDGEAFYKIVWDGEDFTLIQRLKEYAWGSDTSNETRTSEALGVTFESIGHRLENLEEMFGNVTTMAARVESMQVDGPISMSSSVTNLTGDASAHSMFVVQSGAETEVTANFDTAQLPKLFCVYNDVADTVLTIAPVAVGDSIKLYGSSTGNSILLAVKDDVIVRADLAAYGSAIERTIDAGDTAITLDWANADTYHLTLNNTAPLVITNSGARPGQRCVLLIKQGVLGSHTVSFGAETAFGSDVSEIVLSVDPGKTDQIGLSYNWVSGKYNVVALARGY